MSVAALFLFVQLVDSASCPPLTSHPFLRILSLKSRERDSQGQSVQVSVDATRSVQLSLQFLCVFIICICQLVENGLLCPLANEHRWRCNCCSLKASKRDSFNALRPRPVFVWCCVFIANCIRPLCSLSVFSVHYPTRCCVSVDRQAAATTDSLNGVDVVCCKAHFSIVTYHRARTDRDLGVQCLDYCNTNVKQIFSILPVCLSRVCMYVLTRF